MYKIYLGNRFIVISSQPDRMQKYCLFLKYHDIDELYVQISAFLNKPEITSLNIYSYKVDALWLAFKEYFEVRPAAGGLLCNDREELLFIKRHGRWDAPKGHLEKDESIHECAAREIKEETGLVPGDMISKLKPGYHIYKSGGKDILKVTQWYIFSYSGKGRALPQEEEGITEVSWFNKYDLQQVHSSTWPSISDLIHNAISELGND
ncbi:MAG: NUDIX domain-containing protein [Bacteroidales bacterium]|nr:NUDIX domain-containing protein [Bacteroidales bacterium]